MFSETLINTFHFFEHKKKHVCLNLMHFCNFYTFQNIHISFIITIVSESSTVCDCEMYVKYQI